MKRISQRIPLGIGAVGGYGTNGSGDIFLAFATANEAAACLTQAFELVRNAIIEISKSG